MVEKASASMENNNLNVKNVVEKASVNMENSAVIVLIVYHLKMPSSLRIGVRSVERQCCRVSVDLMASVQDVTRVYLHDGKK